jgi:hypothetical protein
MGTTVSTWLYSVLQIRGDAAPRGDLASSRQAILQQGKLYGKDHGPRTVLAEVEPATDSSGLSSRSSYNR